MSHFVLSAWVTFFSTSFLASLVFVKGKAKLHKIFSAYSLCIALWALCFAQHVSSEEATRSLLWSRPLHIFAAFIPVLFLSFTFTLIAPKRVYRTLLKIAAGGAIFFSGLSAVNSPLFMSGVRPRPGLHNLVEAGPLYPLFFAFFIVCATYGLWLIWRAYLRASGISQAQLRYLLLGSLLGYSGGIDNFLIVFDIRLPLLAPFGTYAIPLYVLIASYAIVRYRLMDINVVLARLATFILFYLPLLLLPIIGGNALQPFLGSWLGAKWWIVPVAFEALFAVGGLAAYRYIQEKAERRVRLKELRIHDILRRASQDMTQVREVRKLLRLTARVLIKHMEVSHLRIYLFDREREQYKLMIGRRHESSPSGGWMSPEAPVIHYLREHKDAVVREEMVLQRHQGNSADLNPLVEQLTQLRAECVIPSFSGGNLLGFVVLGAKRSGRMYTDDDLKVLVTLANQAGLAIENAQFWETERERQAQMFHNAQLADLGTMAGSMSHQINNRFYAITSTAGSFRQLLKDLGFQVTDPTQDFLKPIRIPPNALQDLLEKLKGLDIASLPEPYRELIEELALALAIAERNALHGGSIVQTLLNFARRDDTFRPLPFADVIQFSRELSQYRVKFFEEFDLETVVAEPVPMINGNRNSLAEVLNNLIANGYDAIKEKEEMIQRGELKVASGQNYRGKITIQVAPITKNGETWLQIKLSDNGKGIPRDTLHQLFIPFYTTKATSQKGTGLGLYVIQQIIARHGGAIEVDSVYGEGTAFTILLPALKTGAKE